MLLERREEMDRHLEVVEVLRNYPIPPDCDHDALEVESKFGQLDVHGQSHV